MWLKKFRKQKGFTLVEILVVIIIIIILALIILLAILQAQKKGRDSRRADELRTLVNGVQEYGITQGGIYPVQVPGADIQAIRLGNTIGKSSIPQDPRNVYDSSWPNYYYYAPDASDFFLCAKLEADGTTANPVYMVCSVSGCEKRGVNTCGMP